MHSRPEVGDYIGGESCVDLKPDIPSWSTAGVVNRPRWISGDAVGAEKKYPPPIQLQFVMKKYSMSDGRLVIKEDKLKRHQYLEAHRSNGRLKLNLLLQVPAENMDQEEMESQTNGGDGGVLINDIDPTTMEKVISHECYRSYNDQIRVSTCGGFVAVAAALVHT